MGPQAGDPLVGDATVGGAHQTSSSGRRSASVGWRPSRSGASAAVHHHRPLPRGAQVDQHLAPAVELAAPVPRLLEPGPRGPAGTGPQQHALVVGPHGGAEGAHTGQALPRIRGLALGPHRGQQVERPPRRDPHDLVAVRLAPHLRGTQLRDGPALLVRHQDAVQAAPAQRRGHRPPLGQRRVLVAAARRLVGQVGGQAVPAVQLPHVDHLGPAPGRPHRRPDAVAQLVALPDADRHPVGGHVVLVAGAVVPHDVDQLVDVDLGHGGWFEGHSGR